MLLASLTFYAYGEPKFVFVMIASITMNYFFGLAIAKAKINSIDIDALKTNKQRSYKKNNCRRAKLLLSASIIFNIGLLAIFKYLNFAISNIDHIFENLIPQTSIALPIGISFFTFQAMSYVIDVYRGTVKVQENPFFMGFYISFFPQLIAGPIVRYKDIEERISDREITFDDFAEGVRRFIIGISKKVLIANNMAIIADKAFEISETGDLSVTFAWMGALAFSMQIYFDFSGYSDMAIGLGRMFGFKYLENFNYPYISKSVTEFWRRWHISLSSWFRDYVYVPMGGSRVKKMMLFRNLFIVWMLTGIWHGASWSFVIWGFVYFVLLAFEKFTGYPNKFKRRISKSLYQIFTLTCVVINWVIFYDAGLNNTTEYIFSMFGLNGNAFFDMNTWMYLCEYFVIWLIAVLYSTSFFEYIKNEMIKKSGMGENIVSTTA
ncbi:MAG: MBOAT family protein, partial [Clostridiaceae bacterium]|nr:MBOAT family protein [Clostridiaceae bacterium]